MEPVPEKARRQAPVTARQLVIAVRSPLCCRNFGFQCLGRIQGHCHEETGCRGGSRRHVDLVRSASSGPRGKCCPGRGFGIGCFWTGGRGRRSGGRIYGRTRDRQFLGNQAATIQGAACSATRPRCETTRCRHRNSVAGCENSAATSGPSSGNGCQHKIRAADFRHLNEMFVG